VFKPVLALDLGMTTLGICISRSGHMASSLDNLKFQKGSFDSTFPIVLKYIKQENAGIVVVGRPSYPSGDPTEMTYVVEEYVKNLREYLNSKSMEKIEIELQDEQGSTLEASENLHNMNLNAKKQKQIIDQNAAKVILERWLKNKGYDVW